MAGIKYIFYFVFLHTCLTVALECGDNEVEEECPAFCKSYSCPRSEKESLERTCKKPTKCPAPSCKSACTFNHRRNATGFCIPTRECPPFKCSQPNQVFNPCPPYCPTDDCSQATPDGRCPPGFGNILVVLECSPACRCKKGYWKKDDICVPYAECGKTDSADHSVSTSSKTTVKHKPISIAESVADAGLST